MITRRLFFASATASLITAPAIVRAASLMPVRALVTGHKFILPQLPAAAWRDLEDRNFLQRMAITWRAINQHDSEQPKWFTPGVALND
jgi:hypothetical protein